MVEAAGNRSQQRVQAVGPRAHPPDVDGRRGATPGQRLDLHFLFQLFPQNLGMGRTSAPKGG